MIELAIAGERWDPTGFLALIRPRGGLLAVQEFCSLQDGSHCQACTESRKSDAQVTGIGWPAHPMERSQARRLDSHAQMGSLFTSRSHYRTTLPVSEDLLCCSLFQPHK